MKKILPILALIGTSALIVGVSTNKTQDKTEGFINNLQSFNSDLKSYANFADKNLTKTAFNKYRLTIETENMPNTSLVNETENTIQNINEENATETEIDNDTDEKLSATPTINNQDNEKMLAFYSLSNDIEEKCDDFCELKEDITKAIVETQDLINKVKNKEIELSNEQRLFITEQAQQLKSLGRQLSSITTELSFNLSDLNQIMTTNDKNIDNLSMKYLVVLDNLVNGNEMLQSGLTSLNLINQMFNMRSNGVPSNNYGRVLYGFQHNDDPAVVKDYYIDENGKLIENNEKPNESSNELNNEVNQPSSNENTSNIDTYQNNKLNSNIDTYQNSNTPKNIDSFFNTALFNNEFMYGNGYGYGPNNPYYNHNAQNPTYSNTQNNNTQDVKENETEVKDKNQTKKERQRIKLKKNIDTYKDENEPHISVKLNNIKNSISGFFGKFKKMDVSDKIENPIYRFSTKNNEE